MRHALTVAALALALAGCNSGTDPEGTIILEADFNEASGWAADFVDVAATQEADVNFVGKVQALPPNLPADRFGLYHAGTNISDDLFMYFKKQVIGVVPDQVYDASFEVSFASTAGAGCDVGPSSIWVKAGASQQQPSRRVDNSGILRLSVDKGQQQNDGASALNLGDIRNTTAGCTQGAPFAAKTVTSGSRSIEVQATPDGSLWVFLGSESGFEIRHELYFLTLKVTLRPK
jgi:hypothetical protein